MTAAASGDRRTQVLAAVRGAAEPIAAAELAASLGVHPNTARFHLEALERTGEIERTEPQPEPDGRGRGRPAIRFRACATLDDGVRRHELLVRMLAATLESTEHGRARAAEAGFAWGRAHAQSAPLQPAPADLATGHDPDAVGALVGLLGEIGFAPRRTDPETIELWNCPFREAVDEHAELICGIHAGLMRGALSQWRPDAQAVELRPFAAPGLCRARVPVADAA